MDRFSVATFNVHQWADADWEDNLSRVQTLVKKHDPDILCLQEAGGKGTDTFAVNGYPFCLRRSACAILSKIPIELVESKRKGRFLTAKVELGKNLHLYLTCLHLDHRMEPTRLVEVEAIHNSLSDVFKADYCQIWTGDFNALTKEDYSEEYWDKITSVRAKNSWELPQVELTNTVKSWGFKDAWVLGGKPEPTKTCRFDTRIDYVYANEKLLSHFKVKKVIHVDDKASDHNMVKVTFKRSNVVDA